MCELFSVLESLTGFLGSCSYISGVIIQLYTNCFSAWTVTKNNKSVSTDLDLPDQRNPVSHFTYYYNFATSVTFIK